MGITTQVLNNSAKMTPQGIKKRKVKKVNPLDDFFDENLQKRKVEDIKPIEFVEPILHKFENEYDLDLSEDFLSEILKSVEDLCIYITNGDPNMERTIEVNRNL